MAWPRPPAAGDHLGSLAVECALRACPASVIDCASGCRYRCVVISDPCPEIFRRTCTGTPASELVTSGIRAAPNVSASAWSGEAFVRSGERVPGRPRRRPAVAECGRGSRGACRCLRCRLDNRQVGPRARTTLAIAACSAGAAVFLLRLPKQWLFATGLMLATLALTITAVYMVRTALLAVSRMPGEPSHHR
jgi:hypothetical protein